MDVYRDCMKNTNIIFMDPEDNENSFMVNTKGDCENGK